MKITIERRANKAGDRQSIRLVYWHGSHTDENGKIKHRRTREQLDQFLYFNPKDKPERQHNKEVMQLIEAIRAKRLAEAAAGQHGFTAATKTRVSFWAFFDDIMRAKTIDGSQSNHSVWHGCRVHLQRYHPDDGLTVDQITPEWVDGARQFLENKATTKTGNRLSRASASTYFNKLRAVLNAAQAKGLIRDNPLSGVKRIKAEESARVYLTVEELRALAATDCRYDVLKRAFLFSCLTGLRWSDINKLDWGQYGRIDSLHRITFHQQKTGTLQYLDITPQAVQLMGEAAETGRVFQGLKYSSWMNVELLRWCMAAGITKHVTFHTGRHTFAVALLSAGESIYTVSRLLGHSEVKTTQIYADIIDQTRQRAVHKIPSIGL